VKGSTTLVGSLRSFIQCRLGNPIGGSYLWSGKLKMRISGNYGTHLAPLIQCMGRTHGDVLEMGMGYFSTPYLHYQCLLSERHLTSYDNDKGWVKRFSYSTFSNHKYQGRYHDLIYVKSFDDAKIEKPWDVALIDHSPSERRIVDVRRLSDYAKYIVIHDSNDDRHGRKEYKYQEVYPLFKHRKVWDKEDRHATVLSNFESLEDLW